MVMSMAAARINANLTQEESSKALGIHRNTLSNYENYKAIPDITLAQKMAALYGTTVDNIRWSKNF